MSFKRDESDTGWINGLQKRRVDDLLAEGIPEDEAFLMKNGRYSCTVCNYRPVFDTLAILGIHRRGKKHGASVEYQKAKKQELEELKIQRRHEEYLKTGKEEGLEGTNAKHLGDGCVKRKLVAAPRYDPRVKKAKRNKNRRLPTLDLGESDEERSQTIEEFVKRQQIEEERAKLVLKPYERKGSARGKKEASEPWHAKKKEDPLPECLKPPELKVKPTISKTESLSSKSHGCMTEEETEKHKRALLYLQARGAGWKKDCGGNWVQDDDVEFDSDEEPPDLP